MKRLLLAAMSLIISLSATAKEQPKWLKDAVIYHIYPSSYMDSNGDGIGDLNGIRQRLDYIRSVGFNCIWMSPCFESAWEDGGYDILDYYKVDPRFGTNEDLFTLIEEAHERGIKVLLDLVAGHTSDKHPWFKEACKAEPNRYSDYFIWTKDKSVKPAQSSSNNRGRWIDRELPREGYFLTNYFDIQPSLNYGYYNPNPANEWEQGYDSPGPKAVREELKKIIAYWCDHGADGFRVDMASSLIKNDTPEREGVIRLWNEIFAWYNAKYPENIMLSEWANPRQSLSAGFNIDLLIHNNIGGKIYRPLVCETDDKANPTTAYFSPEGKGSVRQSMETYAEVYNTFRSIGGYASLPTCSHDIWRLTRLSRTTPEEQKIAITLFLTLPAPPIVYYGEEIGMRNLEHTYPKEGSLSSRDRTSCRTPMQWDTTINAGFSTVEDCRKLFLPVDPAPEFPNVAKQQSDPNSVLNYVRGLIALRREIPALGTAGDWEYVGDMDNPYPMIYSRSLGNEKYVVVFNPSKREVSGSTAPLGKGAKWIYGNNPKLAKCKSSKEGHTFVMKPFSVAIFRIDN